MYHFQDSHHPAENGIGYRRRYEWRTRTDWDREYRQERYKTRYQAKRQHQRSRSRSRDSWEGRRRRRMRDRSRSQHRSSRRDHLDRQPSGSQKLSRWGKTAAGMTAVAAGKTQPQPVPRGTGHRLEERVLHREEAKERQVVRDDEEGHLVYRNGDILDKRYEVVKTLGQGTFGKVVACKDKIRGKKVAVKIIKNVEKYRVAAKIEIRVLRHIKDGSESGADLCVKLLDWFDYYGHICLTFDLLGLSVFDFLKENGYHPYPLDHVRRISYQLIKSVKYLHSTRLTHTDLKPENVLFVNHDYDMKYSPEKGRELRVVRNPDIVLIDFGSATFDDEHHSTIVSTRHYRSPEVILELGWSHPCDMWSVGCIMFELYRGFTLFQTHNNREHLGMMETILGPLPPRMCRESAKSRYFTKSGQLDWEDESIDTKYISEHCFKLKEYNMLKKDPEHEALFDLMEKLLVYRPYQRLNAREALRHRFFEPLWNPKRSRIPTMSRSPPHSSNGALTSDV